MQHSKKIDSTAFYRKIYRQKGKILEEILKSEPEGSEHQQLADILDVHRDVLRKYMKELLKFGIVIREGKKGKYHLNKDLVYPDFIKGLILGMNFSHYILGKDNIILFDQSAVYNNHKKNIIKDKTEEEVLGYAYDKKDYYLKYFEPKFDDASIIEKKQFEFINQIGAYYLHVFLEQLNRYNSQEECMQNISHDIQWLDGALNRIHSRIYYEFIDKFFKIDPTEKQLVEILKYIKENKLPKTNFAIKRTFLLLSFFHMYPIMGHQLHNMAEELGDDVKFHNEKRDHSLKEFIKRKQLEG